MEEKGNISILEAGKIAKAAGYRAGMPVSELQAFQIVSAGYVLGYSAGLKAAGEGKEVLSE